MFSIKTDPEFLFTFCSKLEFDIFLNRWIKVLIFKIFNLNCLFRFLVDCGLSKPALKDRAVESRERGTEFLLPLNSILDRMHKPEERDRFVIFVLLIFSKFYYVQKGTFVFNRKLFSSWIRIYLNPHFFLG